MLVLMLQFSASKWEGRKKSREEKGKEGGKEGGREGGNKRKRKRAKLNLTQLTISDVGSVLNTTSNVL